MQTWQIIAAVVFVVVLIPTIRLMNQVNEMTDKQEKQKKERQLKWCTRALIVVFLIVLGVTMTGHYTKLSALH